MSHMQRIILIGGFFLSIAVYVVFMTEVVTPIMNVAESAPFKVQNGPFSGAYLFIRDVGFLLMVPIWILTGFAYMIAGPAQEELQKEKRRRQL